MRVFDEGFFELSGFCWLKVSEFFRHVAFTVEKRQVEAKLNKAYCLFSARSRAVFSTIFWSSALSANWLYFAIAATISAYGVPADGSVSRISLEPTPVVRYLGLDNHFMCAPRKQ